MADRHSAAERIVEPRLDSGAATPEFFFPKGILGFPGSRRYRLERFCPIDGGESPFLLLSSAERDLSFPVIHPESAGLEYRLPMDPELIAALGADSTADLVPLLIVTVRERLAEVTVNLQGPLVLNPHRLLGTQWVVEEYPLRQPLLASL